MGRHLGMDRVLLQGVDHSALPHTALDLPLATVLALGTVLLATAQVHKLATGQALDTVLLATGRLHTATAHHLHMVPHQDATVPHHQVLMAHHLAMVVRHMGRNEEAMDRPLERRQRGAAGETIEVVMVGAVEVGLLGRCRS